MGAQNINELLAVFFKLTVDDIDDKTKLMDISGWDSLKHMNLIVTLENEHNVQFDMDEIASMDSVGSIKNVLTGKGVII